MSCIGWHGPSSKYCVSHHKGKYGLDCNDETVDDHLKLWIGVTSAGDSTITNTLVWRESHQPNKFTNVCTVNQKNYWSIYWYGTASSHFNIFKVFISFYFMQFIHMLLNSNSHIISLWYLFDDMHVKIMEMSGVRYKPFLTVNNYIKWYLCD